jgi:hypothetical protein
MTSNMKPRAIHPSGMANFSLVARFLAKRAPVLITSPAPSIAVSTIAPTAGGSHLDSPGRPVRCRAAAREPGTQRGHELGHVPHQVIVDFSVIDYHHAAMTGVKGAGHPLSPEPRCSTMIVVAWGSRRSPKNFRRLPLSAEPTSVTTESTA